MDSYSNDDDLHGFPAAPKGGSGAEGLNPQGEQIPPSEPFTGAGSAWESGSLFPPFVKSTKDNNHPRSYLHFSHATLWHIHPQTALTSKVPHKHSI